MGRQQETSEPLYVQIKEYLQAEIQRGAFPSGSRLPSERSLAEQFSVSRMTARQALQSLIVDGVLYTRVGVGTFVRPRISQNLSQLTSFTEDVEKRGGAMKSRVLAARIDTASPLVASSLQLPVGTEIVVLSRVRVEDGMPLAIEHCHLKHEDCHGILDGHDFQVESLYQVLREEYAWTLVWADQVIEARLPTPVEQELLEIDRQTPVLSIQRITHNHHDHPVEFVNSIYRSDHFRLRTILRHSGQTVHNG